MREGIKEKHPLFIKYTRTYLNQVTGYTKGYLCRVATGKTPLSRVFIERVSLKLKQPEEELFSTDGTRPARCLEPWGCPSGKIGQWLEGRLRQEHLSLRQAAAITGLSHVTIADIINGDHPAPETVRKLAIGFGGDGKQGLVLEDQLLTLAGYRTPRPEGEEIGESLARLLDKVSEFSEPQLGLMTRFADFLVEIGNQEKR